MRCPKCNNDDTRVVWSRDRPEAGMRRRRQCSTENGGCGHRFSTCEVVVPEDRLLPVGDMVEAEQRRLAANREVQDAGQRR